MKSIILKATPLSKDEYSITWNPQVIDINKFALRLDENGVIEVLADEYGSEESGVGGSGRACIFDNVSIKGIGLTPLAKAERGSGYDTGIQNEKGCILESSALMIVNILAGGIAPLGTISLIEKAKLSIAGLPANFKMKSNKGLLLREAPTRFSHYTLPDSNGREFLQKVKRYHQLDTENVLEIANYFIHLSIFKRVYLDMLRFKIFDSSLDNLDISGNVFDLPISGYAAGFTNANFIRNVKLYDSLNCFGYCLTESVITHMIKPTSKGILNHDLVQRYLFNNTDRDSYVHGVIEKARSYFAPMLLGLTNADVAEIKAKIGEKKFDKKMKVLSKYIYSDPTVTSFHIYMMENKTKGVTLPSLIKMLNHDTANLSKSALRVYKQIKEIIDFLKPYQKKNAFNILGERVSIFGSDFAKNKQGFDDPITFSLVAGGGQKEAIELMNAIKKDTESLPSFYHIFSKAQLLDIVKFDESLLIN